MGFLRARLNNYYSGSGNSAAAPWLVLTAGLSSTPCASAPAFRRTWSATAGMTLTSYACRARCPSWGATSSSTPRHEDVNSPPSAPPPRAARGRWPAWAPRCASGCAWCTSPGSAPPATCARHLGWASLGSARCRSLPAPLLALASSPNDHVTTAQFCAQLLGGAAQEPSPIAPRRRSFSSSCRR